MGQMKRSKLAVVDAAARLRAGDTLDAVAADAGITRHTLMDRLGKAGFSLNGESRSVEQRNELKTYLASKLRSYAEPWMDEGICSQVDADLWFPEHGGSTKEAKLICSGCPVAAPCLEYALRHGERFGVWGNKSERERRKMLKERAA